MKAFLLKAALPVLALASYARAATTCATDNISCMIQPVIDLLGVLPSIIAQLNPIVIQLAILGAVVAAIGAIAAIFLILPYIVKKIGDKVGKAI